jgi:uncharacterized protein YjiS (DUF1127 family)
VLGDSNVAAAAPEIRRHRPGSEGPEMFDPNWKSAATSGHPATALSKGREAFRMEASNRSTPYCRAARTTVNPPHMPPQTAPAVEQDDTRSPRGFTALQRITNLLRRWRERVLSRPRLYELDDHILRDIGLTREALLFEETWRVRR